MNNKYMLNKISLWQRISLILFGLFLTIGILEIGLRIGGFTILSIQEHRNLQSIKQKGVFRIMCLGESTTQNKYPVYLEKILNQRNIGIKFSVIDKGLGGICTAAILLDLKANLGKYQPDMVITMMGINDIGDYIPYEAASTSKIILILRSFKVYKLARLSWLRIVNKFKETESYVQDITKQKNLLEKEYSEFQQEQSLKKAIELNPNNYFAYAQLGWLYELQGRFTEAEQLYKKAIKFNPDNERLYKYLATIYSEIGNNELSEVYAKKANSLIDKYYNPAVVNNYRTLKQILDKRRIRLVCAQYPVRNIEPLKKIFKEEMEGSIVFVDNEKIFKDAIREKSYKEYFNDMFGGDFGHCTKKGNQLLAQNIADTILREVFHK